MKRHLVIVSALAVAGVVGCNQCGHQPLFPNAPWNKGCGCGKTAPRATAPVGVVPGQPMPLAPDAAVAPPPGGSAFVPAPAGQPSFPAAPVAPVPSAPAPSPVEIRGYGPTADSSWHAPTNNGGVRLAIPESAPPRESARLNQPESPRPTISESHEPPPAPLPAHISQFILVYERVASGLRPANLEGLDWLKANGYRTVLYLRQAGDDENTDRQAMERRGLKYLSLEVSPQNLREMLEQFNNIVSDAAGYPLFVYSKNSMISGSLWYLRFRTVDRLADDTARAKAARLGLQEEQTEANRPLWLAIQKVLEQVK